jgi:hypothetical protein
LRSDEKLLETKNAPHVRDKGFGDRWGAVPEAYGSSIPLSSRKCPGLFQRCLTVNLFWPQAAAGNVIPVKEARRPIACKSDLKAPAFWNGFMLDQADCPAAMIAPTGGPEVKPLGMVGRRAMGTCAHGEMRTDRDSKMCSHSRQMAG